MDQAIKRERYCMYGIWGAKWEARGKSLARPSNYHLSSMSRVTLYPMTNAWLPTVACNEGSTLPLKAFLHISPKFSTHLSIFSKKEPFAM
ncbi:hypothetical protein RvY_11136 [Ramazzottius varieornatus]|uniref:Uncharacterized protein n=1 Tax=Ramazzottius varieornatus TaxID=947166 RepID=A0A1D1VH64_RAMVA|nr:hypothetical protein RvY_11136 [Ramazzottius varieornatus]